MLDQDGTGRGPIEEEFERVALLEQRIRALLGIVGFAMRGGKLDA